MDTLVLIVLIILVVMIGALLILLGRQMKQKRGDEGESALLVQQQIDALRSEVSQSLRNTADLLGGSLQRTTDVSSRV